MQDITAYTIITVVRHVVCCVGFGFVAFLMYHDRGNWGLLFVGILLLRCCARVPTPTKRRTSHVPRADMNS